MRYTDKELYSPVRFLISFLEQNKEFILLRNVPVIALNNSSVHSLWEVKCACMHTPLHREEERGRENKQGQKSSLIIKKEANNPSSALNF